MKKNNLEFINEILKKEQKENKKLFEENKRLNLRIEMLEIILFRLIRKEIFNEKS